MLGDFFRYGLVKTARKALWKPYADLRAALSKGAAARPRAGRTAYGVQMIQRWHDRTFVYCHAGIYGRFLANELTQRSEPFTFVDIGANQGLYSLIAAGNTSCQGVIAFEPVPSTYSLLEANIALNSLSTRIRPYCLGIAEREGKAEIHVPDGHSGMASLSGGQERHAADGGTETIQTVGSVRLGRILEGEGRLLVKVDVEGLEAVVIRELLDCEAARRVEGIFYEVDSRWSDAEKLAEMLKGAGFKRFDKVGFGHHFDVMARR